MNAYAIIVAGGRGVRMGGDIPKQLLLLDGKSIFERTLASFLKCGSIAGIVVVAHPEAVDAISGLVTVKQDIRPIIVIPGGTERQHSVANGLREVPDGTDVVVVHDAIRPFITPALIDETMEAAMHSGAACCMRPMKETVKIVRNKVIERTIDRSTVWVAQTPQAFRRDILIEAHRRAKADGFIGTDDCMLVERLGQQVQVVRGGDLNIKITTPADLKIAEMILELMRERGEPCCE